MKLLLKIAYLGTAYCGYQVQPNGTSVQAVLNRAARDLFGYECDIVGCSRTDSGVHARDFRATVSAQGERGLRTSIPPDRVPRALNAYLPPDVAVLAARPVPDDFHARYDVTWKEYEYLLCDGGERDPFLANRVWHLPQPLDGDALTAMQAAAAHFVGTRDFSALRGGGESEENAIRTVLAAEVSREGRCVSFRVRANGFLYNMVRIMTGTLVDVARGRTAPADIPRILDTRDRRRAGETAPACGLYLNRVFYESLPWE